MAYLVLAYPKISQTDFEWIQNYRKANDPRYFHIVGPHFTLVFGMAGLSRQEFVQEVKERLESFPKFQFEIRVATINLDDSKEYYHEFLVPDMGYSNIVKIHDQLYSGVFREKLRLDIDYIPHIGIGNSDSAQLSKARVDELNKKGVTIVGAVDVVDIVEYKDGVVTTIEKVFLR